MEKGSIPTPEEYEKQRLEREKQQLEQQEAKLQKEYQRLQKVAEPIIKKDIFAFLSNNDNKLLYYCFCITEIDLKLFRMMFQQIFQPFEAKGWFFNVISVSPVNAVDYDYKTISPSLWASLTYHDFYVWIRYSTKYIDSLTIYNTPRKVVSKKLFVSDQCVICLDQSPEYYFSKCLHLCVCNKCRTNDNICPLCRTVSKTVKRSKNNKNYTSE